MSFDGELRGISKSFGKIHANQGVDLIVRAGTIHALIGENGAGKSTAMKILFGAIKPDGGTIKFGGNALSNWNPERAFGHGIGMVHQHFMLAGPETVHDNLVLGAETTRLGLRRRSFERQALEELMSTTGLRVPLDLPVEKLPIGLQSRCEILKVLYRKARFLILDEPTAVLTPQEIEDLLSTLRVLRDQGKTVLLVTHKLKEVMAIADEATVLRSGRTVATRKIGESSVEELSELMVGRRISLPRARKLSEEIPAPVLRLAMGISRLELRPGEITGVAGVEGNGQEKLIHAITDPHSAADLEPDFDLNLLGVAATRFQTADIRRLPIAIIPADRHREGLVLGFSLTENLRLGRRQAGTHGLFNATTRQERELLAAFDVRPNDPRVTAGSLSGGNQQKLIVARELGDLEAGAKGALILAVHPTRGVDLGAIEFIHGRLLDAAHDGAAVLLISSELDELMALSHRIGVIFRGEITEWFEPRAVENAALQYDEKAIGMAMLSGRRIAP